MIEPSRNTPNAQEPSGRMDAASLALAAAAKEGITLKVLSLLQQYSDGTHSELTPESLRALAVGHAAECGHADLVADLLRLGVGPEIRETVLRLAANKGHDGVTKALLGYHRLLPVWPYLYRKGRWMTGFLDAVALGHLATVRVMLDKGISANLRYQCADCLSGRQGRCGICRSETPIWLAAHNGRGDIVQLLIARGAKARAEPKKGETALHRAAERGDEQMVRQLLRAGWDPNRPDARKWTPIFQAARRGHRAIFDILLQNGGKVGNHEADCLAILIDTKNSAGLGMVLPHLPPATFARFTCNQWDKVYHAIQPLKRAVETGDVAVTRCILDYNRKHNVLPAFEYGQGFRSASESRHEALMGLLVEYCPWTDRRTREEHIFHAVKQKSARGHLGALLMLLEWHDEFGRCPPLLAAAFVTAVHFGQIATAQALITNAGADVHSRIPDRAIWANGKIAHGWTGDSPLHIAARNGSVGMCNLLLEHGACVGRGGYEGNSVLHVAAARASSVTVLELLLDHGADIEERCRSGKTPIHTAKGADNIACLHKAGANLNHQDFLGRTALYWAAYEGDIEKYERLIELGADDRIRDWNGKSARECHEAKLEEIERKKNCRCFGGWIRTGACWCPR